MFDYLIIGGGLNGLAIAALLSRKKKSVLVLEETSQVGGRNFLLKKEGFFLDLGLHVLRLGRENPLYKICRYLGEEIELVPLGKFYIFDQDQGFKEFPTSPWGLVSSSFFSFKEKIKAIKLINKIKKTRAESWLKISVSEWLAAQRVEGNLRKYIELVSSSMLVCPFLERASAGELMANIQKALKAKKATAYPRGGWHEIINLFLRNISPNKIMLDCPAKSIVIEKGRVVGVKTDDRLIEASKIIYALPIQKIYQLIYKGLCEQKTLDSLRPVAGFSLDLALNKKISSFKGLVYFYRPNFFCFFPSNLSPEIAPQEKQLLTVFAPVEGEKIEDSHWCQEFKEKILAILKIAWPELTESIFWQRPLFLKTVDGAEPAIDQLKEKRIKIEMPNIKGLYFVGDGCNAEGVGGDIGYQSVIDCFQKLTDQRILSV